MGRVDQRRRGPRRKEPSAVQVANPFLALDVVYPRDVPPLGEQAPDFVARAVSARRCLEDPLVRYQTKAVFRGLDVVLDESRYDRWLEGRLTAADRRQVLGRTRAALAELEALQRDGDSEEVAELLEAAATAHREAIAELGGAA